MHSAFAFCILLVQYLDSSEIEGRRNIQSAERKFHASQLHFLETQLAQAAHMQNVQARRHDRTISSCMMRRWHINTMHTRANVVTCRRKTCVSSPGTDEQMHQEIRDLVCKDEGAEDTLGWRNAPSEDARTLDPSGQAIFVVLSIPLSQLTLEVLVQHRVYKARQVRRANIVEINAAPAFKFNPIELLVRQDQQQLVHCDQVLQQPSTQVLPIFYLHPSPSAVGYPQIAAVEVLQLVCGSTTNLLNVWTRLLFSRHRVRGTRVRGRYPFFRKKCNANS